MMTERQRRCILFIENRIGVKFDGGEDGHLAYEFISKYLEVAQKSTRRATTRHGSSSPRWTHSYDQEYVSIWDETDSRYNPTVELPGIYCADDIKGNVW